MAVLNVTDNVFSTKVTRADEQSRWAGGKHVFAAFVMDFNERINRRSKQTRQFLRDFHNEASFLKWLSEATGTLS